MAKVLDFTKQKKEYLTVKLHDKKNTVILIGTPTKKIWEEFTSLNDQISDEDGADNESLNDLYRVCAKVMSLNKGGISITPEYLSDFFDFEDIIIFFRAYSDFVSSITKGKN